MGRLGDGRLGNARLGTRVFGRDLTLAVLSELTKTKVDVNLFLEIQFDSGTKRYWTGLGDESLNGNTFKGTGRLMGLSSVKEGLGLRTDSITFDLSGVDTDLRDIALTEPVQDETVKLWLVFYDDSGGQIDNPVLLFQGHVDDMQVDIDPDNPAIKLRAETGGIDWTRPRTRRYDPRDQKSEFSSDEGFDFVPSLQDLSVTWGTETIRPEGEVGVRNIVYGTAKIKKPPTFIGSTSNGKYLHVVMPVAGHEISKFKTLYLDDQVAWTNSGGVQSTFSNHLRVNNHTGTDSQSADSDLKSEVTDWTSNHRLRGVAYTYCRFKYNDSIYNQGLPEIQMAVDGKKVKDKRDNTTSHDDNISWCMRDYILEPDLGMARPTDDIDEDNFVEAADVCDRDEDLAGGGTEKKYTLNRSFDTDRSPRSILLEMRDAMAGSLTYSGGKFVPIAGVDYTPQVTYKETDLRSGFTVSTKKSRSDRFNKIRGQFVWNSEDYQKINYPAVTDSTAVSNDNNISLWKTKDFPSVDTPSKAQRIAKIMLERNRQQLEFSLDFKSRELLRNRAGDVIQFTSDKANWTDKKFKIKQLEYRFKEEGGGIKILPRIRVKEYTADIYAWDHTTDETTMSSPPSPTTPGRESSQVQRYDNESDFPSGGQDGRHMSSSNDQSIFVDDGASTVKVGDVTGQNTPKNHASRHENGGADEINVGGLSGDLADAQDPKLHGSTHEDGGSDEIELQGLEIKTDGDNIEIQASGGASSNLIFQNTSDGVTIFQINEDTGNISQVGTINGVDIESHASRHENGGSDEISSLDGLSIGSDTADDHDSRHEAGGADEINLEGLDIKRTGDNLEWEADSNNDLILKNATDNTTLLTIDQDTGKLTLEDRILASDGTVFYDESTGNVHVDGKLFDSANNTVIDGSNGDIKLQNELQDSSGSVMMQSIEASGQVQLSGGSATVSTGINTTDATFMLALGVDDPGADTKIVGRLFWDDSANVYKIEIVETDTQVDNPTVNYKVLRVD